MTREEWKCAHRLARIARHRRSEPAGADRPAPAETLEQDIRRLVRHAAILSRAAQAQQRASAAPVPRTRHVAAVGLFLVLIVILSVLARQEVPSAGAPRVLKADVTASVQVNAPDALPSTRPT
jgi:hypothetical protein